MPNCSMYAPPRSARGRYHNSMDIYFSDYFEVERKWIHKHGAFNVSLVADLPLFIDPFLLFNSSKPKYKQLHRDIIEYLRFLRDKSSSRNLDPDLIAAWYRFPEVHQTWLGFSASGNKGRGLGSDFAQALHENLNTLFHNFGQEQITKGSHLEKLCLIKDGVGRDNISDFTTNLVKGFLLDYSQSFSRKYIAPTKLRSVPVRKVRFNYQTESWQGGIFQLPWFRDDYVLLVPKDMLTKDDTWINKSDLVSEFENVPESIPDNELRAQINNYFRSVLPKEPKKEDKERAVHQTISKFPQLVDYYIRRKEEKGQEAVSISSSKVAFSERLYVEQFSQLSSLLASTTDFYRVAGKTHSEARQRAEFLKDVIENKGGHRIFYVNGEPIERELDLQILYRLTWCGTRSDVSTEVNDGRGPADYKISRGAHDKTIIEFKLASNPQLRRNLERQSAIYQKASDAKHSLKVIIYFSKSELDRVSRILKELKLDDDPDVILIDARKDNKPSGSKA